MGGGEPRFAADEVVEAGDARENFVERPAGPDLFVGQEERVAALPEVLKHLDVLAAQRGIGFPFDAFGGMQRIGEAGGERGGASLGFGLAGIGEAREGGDFGGSGPGFGGERDSAVRGSAEDHAVRGGDGFAIDGAEFSELAGGGEMGAGQGEAEAMGELDLEGGDGGGLIRGEDGKGGAGTGRRAAESIGADGNGGSAGDTDAKPAAAAGPGRRQGGDGDAGFNEVEDRDVAALGQFDADGGVGSGRGVELTKAGAEAVGFDTDDGIEFGVEVRAALIDFDADDVFLDGLVAAVEGPADDEAQERGHPGRGGEAGTGEDPVQFAADGLSDLGRHCEIQLQLIDFTTLRGVT